MVVGGCLVAGGLLPFAASEVLVTAGLLAWIAWSAAPRKRRPKAVLLAGALALLFGSVRAAVAVRSHDAAMKRAEVVAHTSRCAGTVRVDETPIEQRGSLRWAGVLRGGDCEGVAWSGRVTLFSALEPIARGDDVAVVAQLAPPTRLWNDGDPRPREARQGSERSGGAVDARILRRGVGVLAWIDRERDRVRRRIEATFPEDVAPMARALVLGESDLSAADDAAMRGSGLAHLLAVSGMHLVIAVVAVVAALRSILVRVERLAGRIDVGRVTAMVGIPLAWGYAEFAGDGGSTRRAAWMLTVSFLARALGRRPDPARAFGWSLLAMAAGDPLAVFDVSFVLSGAATAGLFVFSERIASFTGRLAFLPRSIVRSLAATLAATLPCAPILARFSPAVPLGGVVANLLAVPVGESAALPLCLAHGLLRGWPAAERGSAIAGSGALRIVGALARWFAGTSVLSAAVPPPTSWQMVAITVGLLGIVVARKRWRWPITLVAGAAVLLLEIGARRSGRPKGLLRATFLDVGQGDAALVDLPDGSAILIDGGGLVGSPIDTGERVVAPMLRSRRRDRLALAVLSHPHPDHFGGLATGLGATAVGQLWDTGQGEREDMGGGYAVVLRNLRAQHVPILRPPSICGAHRIGGAELTVLAPCPEPTVDRGPNDNSIVLRIAFGERAFLFVGDAEEQEEQDLLTLPAGALRADVLKVGHHGSRTSSSPAFLAAVRPDVAVVSVGARNRFGHPHPTTLASLAGAHARVLRTDEEGAVTVATDGRTLDVSSARRAIDGADPSF